VQENVYGTSYAKIVNREPTRQCRLMTPCTGDANRNVRRRCCKQQSKTMRTAMFTAVNSLLSWFILLPSENQNFHNLCTVLYCLCGLTNSNIVLCISIYSPLLNTLSTEADVHGAQKVLSNNGFWMANCFCCLSQNAMVCLAHCRQVLQQKSWKTAKLFLQDQDQMFQSPDQDQDFHFCPRGASRPRPWSWGQHHWLVSDRRSDSK